MFINKMNTNFQDWTPVVITKSTNKQVKENPSGFKELRQLLEDDIPKLTKMTRIYAQAIIDGRKIMNITQKQLAQKMCIKDTVIKEYENCSIPNFNLSLYKRMLKAVNIDPKTVINT